MPSNGRLHPLSAHIGYLFTELPFEERFAAAAKAGFQMVEHPSPFFLPAVRLRDLLDANGLEFAQISSSTGEPVPGEKGLAVLDGREVEFKNNFAETLDYAEEIGVSYIHAMAGIPDEAASAEATDSLYRRNIEAAIRLCQGRKPRLLIEAISHAAVPGFYMHRTEQLLALAEEFGGELDVLLDTFHVAVVGANLKQSILTAGERLGHVHIADYPGRHEPGTGHINFAIVKDALHEIGYKGAIGFEYIPASGGDFGWMEDW